MVDKGKLASAHKRKICQFYQKSKKCTNPDCCIEQLLSDPSVCTSNIYYCMDLEEQLAPFQDKYFKGLNTSVIAELAKKSNRLTTENRKLEAVLQEIEEYAKTNLRMPLERKVILNIIGKTSAQSGGVEI